MTTNIDEIVSCIYSWLKQVHLLKTARTLQSEYGKEIDNSECWSLTAVFDCYKMFSNLMNTFNNAKPQHGKANDNKKKKMKKRKLEEEKKNTPVELEKKIKRVPLAPPGEFVIPEMEETLNKVFERLLVRKSNQNTATESTPKRENKETPIAVLQELSEEDRSDFVEDKRCIENGKVSDKKRKAEDEENDELEDTKIKKKKKKKSSKEDSFISESEEKHSEEKEKKKKDKTIEENNVEENDKKKKKKKKKDEKDTKEVNDKENEEIDEKKKKKKKKKKKSVENSDNEPEKLSKKNKNEEVTAPKVSDNENEDGESTKKKKKKMKKLRNANNSVYGFEWFNGE